MLLLSPKVTDVAKKSVLAVEMDSVAAGVLLVQK